MAFLEPRRLETVVEIGTQYGGTLLCWCRLAEPDAVILSIDLPPEKFGGGGCTPERVEEMRLLFPRERQALHLLRADSHEQSTLSEVEDILGGKAVDFLFIDGDHTYEGVKLDFEMYGPLVKRGGIIAFHDILDPPAEVSPGCQVRAFWEEIKDGYRHIEFKGKPYQWGGIGALWQK